MEAPISAAAGDAGQDARAEPAQVDLAPVDFRAVPPPGFSGGSWPRSMPAPSRGLRAVSARGDRLRHRRVVSLIALAGIGSKIRLAGSEPWIRARSTVCDHARAGRDNQSVCDDPAGSVAVDPVASRSVSGVRRADRFGDRIARRPIGVLHVGNTRALRRFAASKKLRGRVDSAKAVGLYSAHRRRR